jgi:hypothetical protein
MTHHFRNSFIFTLICLALGGAVGYLYGGTFVAALNTIFIVAVLGVLETSLSFDNAVMNAKTLAMMDKKWQHRFLTWGMAIAVFGMRIVFPLLIVGIAAKIAPWQALALATWNPGEYERVLTSVHAEIAAFGGAFLLMVGLKYFLDVEKKLHWVTWIEAPLVRTGNLYMAEVAIVMTALIIVARLLPATEQLSFLAAGTLGLITYAMTQWIEILTGKSETRESSGGKLIAALAKSGLASFVYLEVLDASFSFDGVIGAFALTNNIFVIALGLGIGAMFVRSLTIMLVKKGTLAEYRYLEHGAFWAILALGTCMILGVFVHIPEIITGLVGAALISISFYSSRREDNATL